MRPPLSSFETKTRTSQEGPGLDSFDSAQTNLARSQKMMDNLRMESQQAELAAQQAQSAGGIAKETAKGVFSSALDFPIKALRTGVQAVGDMFGVTPKQSSVAPEGVAPTDFSGQPLTTYQEDVEAGKETVAGAAGKTALGVASLLPVGKAASMAKPLVKPVAQALGRVAEPLTGALKGAGKAVMDATGITARRAAAGEQQQVIDSINALYKEPTGKKFTEALPQILSGERSIRKASIFKGQGLTVDERTAQLGYRLRDLKLGKDNAKNADTLGRAMDVTENELDEALDEKTLITFADKPGLINKLQKIVDETPEEYRIGDAQLAVNRAVAFAQKLIGDAVDNPKGVIGARRAFDTQARKQFPNAFKSTGVDTKTPAGHAIKEIRDTISEHAYELAPEGSRAQELIGREADIYNAARMVLDKAKDDQELRLIAQHLDKHRSLKNAIGFIAFLSGTSAAGYAITKELGQ